MKKNKHVIGLAILIIFIVLILMPRTTEKIYVLYDQDKIDCTSEIEKRSFQKNNFFICQGSRFVNFIKKTKKKSTFLDLDKIEKLEVISYKNLLTRFNNDKLNHEKNNYDLLNRDKKIEFNLIIKNISTNKIEIIPVQKIKTLRSLELIY